MKGANEVGLEAAIIRRIRESYGDADVSDTTAVKTTITIPGQVSLSLSLTHIFYFYSFQINLSSLVDHSGSECLNESDDHPFANCLKPDTSFLESDCDEQLIIVLAFMQSVKLHTMQIIAPQDGQFATIEPL